MFTKLFQTPSRPPQDDTPRGSRRLMDLEPHVAVHYGIPTTASVLAFDPIQQLLAIGTLDGRIKVIGGDNIEAILMSPKLIPFKNLEFLQNQGYLASVSNDNEVLIWDLGNRCISASLQWESNITAFSLIYGTHYAYIGDEFGYLSVLKYDAEEGNLLQLPYSIPPNLIAETIEISLPDPLPIVGLLPQPCTFGNRVLIVYENGLIILWDIPDDRAVVVRGCKDLHLKHQTLVGSPNTEIHDEQNLLEGDEQVVKEVSSLCWVSYDGSIVAVGYVDGDILLWNISVTTGNKSQEAHKSSDVVKLQLSSGDKRLPIITLRWSPDKTQNYGGQLIVYGGDDIGSEEVLTILQLDWSSGIETLQCVDRIDLSLNGSFADVIVVESTDINSLFVLSNPGQLYYYDNTCMSTLQSAKENKNALQAVHYPAVVPTVKPIMTVSKLHVVDTENVFSSLLKEAVSAAKPTASGMGIQWPLTGGVHAVSSPEDSKIKQIYIAGYEDGSVRLWDATFPVLSLISCIKFNVNSVVIFADASVSALDFSSLTLSLAVGNEIGQICLYRLQEPSQEKSLYVVTETKTEVHTYTCEDRFHCAAIFSLLSSPVCTLKYVSSGDKLVVGYKCNRVAMVDINSLSVLFLSDSVASSAPAIVSLAVQAFQDTCGDSSKDSDQQTSSESKEGVVFVLTQSSDIALVNGSNGNMIIPAQKLVKEPATAISMYILDSDTSVADEYKKLPLMSSQDIDGTSQIGDTNVGNKLMGSLILLCCEDALHLYYLKSLIQGNSDSIHTVKLAIPCSWTALIERNANEYCLVIIYKTGTIEVRSLPDLIVLGETSLSILRWSVTTNMNQTMSSSGRGQITLVKGGEFAIISFLAFHNDFRIPEAFPCLHDKVLAAAADISSSSSLNQRKKQNIAQGIIGGILKGFKGMKSEPHVDYMEVRGTLITHLENIFSRFPFSDPSANVTDDYGDLELNIDDIEVDEAVPVATSSVMSNNEGTIEKGSERDRLFEGGSSVTEPRVRTREEIIAKYRNTGDATSAAAQAKDKLVERQEKLERLSRRTEELQSGAENFASMANELAKAMEKRNKWWNL